MGIKSLSPGKRVRTKANSHLNTKELKNTQVMKQKSKASNIDIIESVDPIDQSISERMEKGGTSSSVILNQASNPATEDKHVIFDLKVRNNSPRKSKQIKYQKRESKLQKPGNVKEPPSIFQDGPQQNKWPTVNHNFLARTVS